MIKIIGIDHIVLRTENLNTMLMFYTDVLGCSIERETAPDMGLTQLRAGSALIDLVLVDSKLGKTGGGPPTQKENNLDHFCLQIKSLTELELKTHLESFGMETGEFVTRYGAQGLGKSLYIKDPDGNTVELKNQL